ncbi:MAG: type I-E CRISPR-associated protein Cse1/CasA [Gammaproteobacteria bacterium]|nr:type I-E CRISPR-associated protein Cse1/CasA [Gammaproteobacteria bacterium]
MVTGLDSCGNILNSYNKFDANTKKISELLIEAPGGNTLKENRDYFVKRGEVNCLCFPCIAMALFTLQTNAPSGGAGHRTSFGSGRSNSG